MTQIGKRHPKRFTGHHAAAIIIAFFAVVIAVNVAMATLAVSTFGGVVVDNSYVAGQRFNGWLREARREKAMGWTVTGPFREYGRMSLSVTDRMGQPLRGATISARMDHPVGRAPERDLSFAEIRPGAFVSTGNVPTGRWKVRLQIQHDTRQLKIETEVH